MQDTHRTRPSLLLRIRDPRDGDAWTEFAGIYSPLVYRYARHHGLQDADAATVTQEVLWKVAKSIGRFEYDRKTGSFRGWLLAVTRSRLAELFAARKRQAQGSGDTGVLKQLEKQSSDEGDEELWEHEYRKSLFHWAIPRIRGSFRDTTWLAFWKTSVEGHETKQVACELKMSVGAVYIARSRVLAKLKKEVQESEHEP